MKASELERWAKDNGIELNPAYAQMAVKCIDDSKYQPSLI